MCPNSHRPFVRSPLLVCCVLLVLPLAAFAGFASMTRKTGAKFVAPSFAKATKAIAPAPDIELASKNRLRESYGKLPLSFETNQGQTDRAVKFLSRVRGQALFLTPTEA